MDINAILKTIATMIGFVLSISIIILLLKHIPIIPIGTLILLVIITAGKELYEHFEKENRKMD